MNQILRKSYGHYNEIMLKIHPFVGDPDSVYIFKNGQRTNPVT